MELSRNINPLLRQYVEDAVLPHYDAFDKGHQRDHAEYVIGEALKLSRSEIVVPVWKGGKIAAILCITCAGCAPKNQQEWEVRIIDSKEYFDSVTEVMAEAMPFFVKKDEPGFRNDFRNATAAIFIACPDDESGMSLINVGLMGENICLAAQSMGLGTCVMGGPAMVLNTTEVAKPYLDKLGFSEGYKLRIVIGVGYPDEAPDTKPRDAGKVKFID